jgi:predicted ArsR family transcriptional regulator
MEPSQEPRVSGRRGKAIKLTDPETMRALAHPARIALWQHLLLEGPATATECAPAAGLSPSACSYHLRQLGRFGFIEQDQAAAANGRERPWRVVVTTTTVDDLEDPVAVMAARLLDNVIQERWDEARRRYEATKEEYPAQWRQAAGGDRVIVYLTPDELATLREQIRELYRPLIRMAGEDRPAGAEPVQGALDFVPIFAPPEALEVPEGLERPERSEEPEEPGGSAP